MDPLSSRTQVLMLDELRKILNEAKRERLELLRDHEASGAGGAVSDIARDLDNLIAKVDSGIIALEGKEGIKNVFQRYIECRDEVRAKMGGIRRRVSSLKGDLIRSRRRKFEYLPEDMRGPVMGLENNIKDLVVQLTKEGDAGCRVACIWGMGGTGKTTLAVQIYRHSEIRSHFAGVAWVSLSDNTWTSGESLQLRDYFSKKIFTQLTNDTDEKLANSKSNFAHEEDNLFQKFQVLCREEGKEYLVILDDIWSKKGMSITHALIYRFPNAKILLTTRNKSVTSDLKASIFFHELRCLDKQQSWELFVEKANFGRHIRSDSEYKEMKELGEKMLQRCGGLPLAITMLGELLSKAHTTFEWQDIMFGREEKTYKLRELKDISHELGLSYHDLPRYLRQCFLYLAHFPKDSEIRVNELCRLWTAEDFSSAVSTLSDSVTSEEKAYGFIDELVQRCMVQVEKLDLCGRIKTLRIHNLMRQLCLVKAKYEIGVAVEAIDSRNIHVEVDDLFYDVLADLRHPSRISIYLNKDIAHELLPLIDSQGYRRSVMCFNRLPYPSYEQVIKPLLKRFYLLTVLKFENLTQGYIGNLPEEIGGLFWLRFLSLKGSHVEQVPSSIGNLTSLETLDLRTKWTLKLPNVLWKLKKLRHSYLGHRSYISGRELWLGNLTNLQTLVNIPLMCCNINDFVDLTQVRNLKFYVHAKWWQKNNPGSIVFHRLRSLAVENISRARVNLTPFISSCLQIEKLRLEGKIEKLPEEKYFPKLIKLTLNRTDLEDDPMMTLEKLPNLKFLLLNYDAFRGKAMVCSNGGFPRLESLSLVALEQLKEWRVEKGALPSLSFLLIEYCYELEAIPDGLRCVTSLEKLVIKRMPRDFDMKIEESGKEFYKVQHVLHIEFLDDEQPYCHPSDSSAYKLSTFSPGLTTHPTNYSGRYYHPEVSRKSGKILNLHAEVVGRGKVGKEVVGTSNKFEATSWPVLDLKSRKKELEDMKSRQKELEESMSRRKEPGKSKLQSILRTLKGQGKSSGANTGQK